MTPLCQWTLITEPTAQARFRCARCGAERAKPLKRNCRPGPPSLRQRFSHYLAARRRWKAAGKPTRSPAQIAALYQICQACPLFRNSICTHERCGCRVSENPKAYFNKLAWKTETCPEGKWDAPQLSPPASFARPTVRHLLYHVCPLDRAADPHEGWRHNLRQLCRHWELFNGVRLIAIVHGERLEPVARVLAEFEKQLGPTAGRDFDAFVLPNDPLLRETATFPTLLEALYSSLPTPHSSLASHAFFYAHTKGNSTAGSRQGAIYWRNAMYHALLGGADNCLARLEQFPAVGTHKMVWRDHAPPYPSGLRAGMWMFAGTFWWLRCDALFASPKWRDVPRDRYGVEAYPSVLFHPEQACSVFQPWPASVYPTPDPYRPELYEPEAIDDEPL